MSRDAHTYWLFGLSGAGKTTLATLVAARLRAGGECVLSLDGDVLREGLCQGLGFSEADRTENIRRAAEVAKLALKSGITVVAAFITPTEAQRREVAEILGYDRVSLIHVNAPLEICQQRDVKGLYRRATAGELRQMTGIDSSFEAPSSPTLRVDTHLQGAEPAVDQILQHIDQRRLPNR